MFHRDSNVGGFEYSIQKGTTHFNPCVTDPTHPIGLDFERERHQVQEPSLRSGEPSAKVHVGFFGQDYTS